MTLNIKPLAFKAARGFNLHERSYFAVTHGLQGQHGKAARGGLDHTCIHTSYAMLSSGIP